MKLTKKKVLISALAVSLIAILSAGSLAWFSDSDSVTNNFYVADSKDTEPDNIFSVNVYEKDETDTYEKGINYNDVLPGAELVKKAYVKNTGYYDQYIRVIVTISDKDVWESVIGSAQFEDYNVIQHFTGFDASKWDLVNSTKTIDETADTIQYVLYYNDVVAGDHGVDNAGEVITVFTGVTIPTQMTQDQAAHFDDDGFWGFTIDVKAQAVQTENVVPDGAAYPCFEAFKTVGMAVTD